MVNLTGKFDGWNCLVKTWTGLKPKGGSMCTDVVAAICSWIEEQSWTTEELYCSLLQGSVGTKMGQWGFV